MARAIAPPTMSAVFALTARAFPLIAWAVLRADCDDVGEGAGCGELTPDGGTGEPGAE